MAGKYNKQAGSHLGFPIRMILATADLQVTSILPMNSESIALLVPDKKFKIDFQDGCHGRNLGLPIGTILAIYYLQVTRCILPSFKLIGLPVQKKKQKIDFQDGRHLGFLIGTI